MTHWRGSLLVLAFLAVACAGERQQEGQAEGMPGMRMPSMEMLPGMRAHLDSVRLASPNDMPGMVAAHRARAEEMLNAIDQDMKAMSMAADAGWQALADSVRADLTALPGLSGESLVLRMRAHAGRMRRLLEMHERIMKM
jgi:hypothetical protein